ncbi:LamG domain-containing protein [Kribbella sp. CA-293567]|uniref:LamG domain-containing protein n=1 Tax=Kribbella sp. CA-293567 TaxID=3002436 RepID=UPI0022DD880E|nr:LamG domain-containing protein [Kribbella sp. CA-293567]WBQ02236.1 LamG domain-containing protein [Kribbella sp. CA-293567]
MARWGIRGVRGAAVVAALSLAIAGLTGMQAAGNTLDDPPVPPAPPQITATYKGVEILNCLGQNTCPETAVTGEPVIFTITATSPDVVRQWYKFGSVTEEVTGTSVTVSLTPTGGGLSQLQAVSINEIGQSSTTAYFRFNAGPRPKPIGSWSFDDGSGTTAADAATPAHPLTVTNGGAFDGKGRVNGSLALDGADDYAQAADPVVDTSKSLTVSAWVRPTNATKNGVVAAVPGTNSSAFGLYYDAPAKRWVFARTSADVRNPARYRASSKEAPVNGAWIHLIGTYDATTGALQLFVNGRLQQTATSPSTPAWQATGPLTVGRGKYAAAFTGNFAGSLDQVNVWQRVLVAEEIPGIVEPRINDGVTAGLAAYWPLDNAAKAPNNVWRTPEAVRGADLTVAGFGATSNQSGAFVDDEERGRVLELTGKARESVTLSPSVIDGGSTFTVALRVKVGDLDKPMVIVRQGTTGKDSWRLEYKPVDQFSSQWIFARGDAKSSTETLATATVDREFLTSWTVLAATFSSLDVNGIGEPAAKLVLTVDLRSSSGSTQTYSGTPLRTGTTVVGAARTSGKSFIGRLDDLRVYSGQAQAQRLCQDYPDLSNCGS